VGRAVFGYVEAMEPNERNDEEHEAREHLIDAEVEAQETLDEAEHLHEEASTEPEEGSDEPT
jgi:hypothetical protein